VTEPGSLVYVWPDSGTPDEYPGVLLGAGRVVGVHGDMADVEIEGVVDCYPLEWLHELPEVAALYVDTAKGAYIRRERVECLGFATRDGRQQDAFALTRDAREYLGPNPVVAHPPCGPWGRFDWNYKGGEGDRACGLRAVEQVRASGGVLEHPSHSKLWAAAGLPLPGAPPDAHGGWSIEINQVDWGHPAVKPTWLYIVGLREHLLPPRPPPGQATHVMVRLRRLRHDLPELSKPRRHVTPQRFADWLLDIARRTRIA
jgi:hypothetical protein